MHNLSPAFNRITWLICSLVYFSLMASAQQTKPDREEMIFTVVEHNPGFPGGAQALKNYLVMHTHYPDSAAKAKLTGSVFVSFVVEHDGQLTQIEVLRGLGYGCDEEALRVVGTMPCWSPGTQSGRRLRVKYNLPIAFGLK